MYTKRIKLIKKIGQVETYDLHTPKCHNFFLNNGILSHNSGKSWLGISLCEKYSKMHNIPFDPDIHTIHTLKQLLQLIRDKKLTESIKIGTPLLFEEPQIEANARAWQTESNQMLSALLSTFRNQRLVVFFSTPYLNFIDKQSRVLFHAEFKVKGFDKKNAITKVEPRYLDYNPNFDKFYYYCLANRYAIENKKYMGYEKISKWEVKKASKELLNKYELIKSQFTKDYIDKLWEQEIAREMKVKNKGMPKESSSAAIGRSRLRIIHELYNKYGEDYFKISEEVPDLSPTTIHRYINLVKKTSYPLQSETNLVKKTSYPLQSEQAT